MLRDVGRKQHLHKRCAHRSKAVHRLGLNVYYVATFDSSSQGQLAMVIYEWKDVEYLGKVTSNADELYPVSASIGCEGLSVTRPCVAQDIRLHV